MLEAVDAEDLKRHMKMQVASRGKPDMLCMSFCRCPDSNCKEIPTVAFLVINGIVVSQCSWNDACFENVETINPAQRLLWQCSHSKNVSRIHILCLLSSAVCPSGLPQLAMLGAQRCKQCTGKSCSLDALGKELIGYTSSLLGL